MRTRKKNNRTFAIMVMIAGCLFMATQTYAQRQVRRPMGYRTRPPVERLERLPSLDDDQKKAVRELNRKYAEKTRDQAAKDRQVMADNMKAIQNDKVNELKSILTEEQYAEYEKSQNDKRRRTRRGRG